MRADRGEELLAQFTRVGDVLLPTSMELRAVFGKEWGPEIIELSQAKLR